MNSPDDEQDDAPVDGDAEKRAADAAARKKWEDWIEARRKDRADYFRECDRVTRTIGTKTDGIGEGKSFLNIAWANREILLPAVYSRQPRIEVKSRFLQADPIARAASEILERSTNTLLDLSGAHEAFMGARDSFVDFAQGVTWVRYEAELEQRIEVLEPTVPAPEGAEVVGVDDLGRTTISFPVKVDERVVLEWVDRDDFLCDNSKAWRGVSRVARRVQMGKAAIERRFGPEIAEKCKMTDEDGDSRDLDVWECWDRDKNETAWFSEGYPDACLEIGPPPLDLVGFFPCPRPAWGTLRDKKLVPRPDLIFIRTQLDQIDKLTKRIEALTESLKVRGFYPGGPSRDGPDAIEQSLKMRDDRVVMIPVAGWAITGQGGVTSRIDWFPLDMVVSTLAQVIKIRAQHIEDVYQITGISDILRGASEASETLGAQQIKAQWGTIRLRPKQQEIARLCRDTARIVAEIVCELFDPATIYRMTRLEQNAERDAALQEIRDDRARSYLIEVETDSTVNADDQAEKAARTEFAAMLSRMLNESLAIAQSAPQLIPVLGEVIKFVARSFRIGRELEQVIDDAIAEMQANTAAPAAAGPINAEPMSGQMIDQGQMLPEPMLTAPTVA